MAFKVLSPTVYAFYENFVDSDFVPPPAPAYGAGSVRYGQSVSTNMPVQDSQAVGVGSTSVRGRERRPV